jgi:hydrogenase maturation factor
MEDRPLTRARKTEFPEIGKISPEIFDRVILPHLGRKRRGILLGPQHGVDVGVIDLGGGKVMALTTDPVFIVPPYGWERSAWFAVHILASDAATSGLPPTYMTIDLNLPLSMSRKPFESMWKTIHRECERLGIAIVAGHTGRYEGCEYPMVGGATVMAIGSKDRYVAPTMAKVRDHVIVTKGAAIEAAGLFAVTFPDRVAERYGTRVSRRAKKIFWQMSVVEDAMTAVRAGVRRDGVTAMHDATECGVWGGIVEIAEASGVGMVIEKERVLVQDDVARICDLFEIDPYISISEGTLIITCRPHRSDRVISLLARKKIPATIVGEVVPAGKGIRLVEGGKEKRLEHPRGDPFWAAFGKAAARES